MRLGRLLLALLPILLQAPGAYAGPADVLADQWDAFLGKYVKATGGVQYEAVQKAGMPALKAFLDAHAKLNVAGWDDGTRRAAYINFYNAGMMANVVRYAAENKILTGSPAFVALKINDLKVSGGNLWNGSYNFALAGHVVTLDNVEHDLIRGKGKGEFAEILVRTFDPRIHAAVNCAAVSCPRLREKAYRAANIDAMLQENMIEFLSSEQQFQQAGEEKLKANSIVFWYYDDFDDYARQKNPRSGAGDYLASFVSDTAKDAKWKQAFLAANFNDRSKIALRISSKFDFAYDWRINDVRNKN